MLIELNKNIMIVTLENSCHATRLYDIKTKQFFDENQVAILCRDIAFVKFDCSKCNETIHKQIASVKLRNSSTINDQFDFCNLCKKLKRNNKHKNMILSARYSNDNNPMFNKSVYNVWLEKYGKEAADIKMDAYKKHMSTSCLAEKNGFFGKKHTKETLEKIKQTKERNKQKLTSERFEREALKRNITKQRIETALHRYMNDNNFSLKSAKEMLNIDNRTFVDYCIKFELITRKEFREFSSRKRLQYTSSHGEKMLYDECKKIFGSENVKTQFRIHKYFYDICILDKLIVEYDGYY